MQLYPVTSASCLCPCPCVDGSGGGDDGGGLCLDPGLAHALLMTAPSWAVPGHTHSAQAPGGTAALAKMLSVL